MVIIKSAHFWAWGSMTLSQDVGVRIFEKEPWALPGFWPNPQQAGVGTWGPNPMCPLPQLANWGWHATLGGHWVPHWWHRPWPKCAKPPPPVTKSGGFGTCSLWWPCHTDGYGPGSCTWLVHNTQKAQCATWCLDATTM